VRIKIGAVSRMRISSRRIAGSFGHTLADAVLVLRGGIDAPADGIPLIDVGGDSSASCSPFHIRALPRVRADARQLRARPLRRDAACRKGRRRGGHTLAVTELLRFLQGGLIHELIDLDLKSPDYRNAVTTQHDFSTLNPGYVLAGP
jgi:hypothetical protein